MSKARKTKPTQTETGVTAPTPKTAIMVALLSRSGGADLAELVEATGWQRHSVRGALAGALKKKGHVIASNKEGERRVYRISADGAES